jgi:hypothetical protein
MFMFWAAAAVKNTAAFFSAKNFLPGRFFRVTFAYGVY